MTDRMDEWALNYLHEFDGTLLQSVAKGAVQPRQAARRGGRRRLPEEAAEAFWPVLA